MTHLEEAVVYVKTVSFVFPSISRLSAFSIQRSSMGLGWAECWGGG